MNKTWTRESAFTFANLLEPKLSEIGWHCALTGDVIFKIKSFETLAVIVYPHRSIKSWRPFAELLKYDLNFTGLQEALNKIGMKNMWKAEGSTDEKIVEVWQYEKKRIHLYVMR